MISSHNVGGGLANQLFQYAAGFAHSKRMGTKFHYPSKPPHVANALREGGLREIFELSAESSGSYGPLYDETLVGFNYNPLPPVKDLTLHGYFQSEKYFKEFSNEVRREFTFRSLVDTPPTPKTVSVHVRRGDYVEKQQYHPVCPLSYYQEAMSLFDDHSFLVFSDDLEWCLDNFKGERIQFSTGKSAEEDLQLMSLCEHHIIANSTFSWWGSWLNPNPAKKVIAPKTWFGPAYANMITRDLYSPDWEVL